MEFTLKNRSTGDLAKVSNEGQVIVYATTEQEPQHVNEDHEEMYSLRISQTPTAANDCIAFIENGRTDQLLVDCVNFISVGANMEIYFKLGDKGTRNSATDATPVNLNSGSGNSANGDSNFETGADLDGGAATLAGGQEAHRYNVLAAEGTKNFEFCGKIVLNKNQTLTVWSTVNNSVKMDLFFHYHI